MSFTNEINTIMLADASLNAYVDVISYENLIDEWLGDLDNNKWIVYESNTQEQVDCLNEKNLYNNISLKVVIVQRNSNKEIDIISDRIKIYLNGITSTNIVDLNFVNDQGGFDEQKNIYSNTLEFNVIYIDS